MPETAVSLKQYFDEAIRSRDERDKIRYESIVEQNRALKELVLSQAESSSKAISTAMAAADKATEKAAQAYEKRFDNTNEWRDAMNDLQNQFPRKTEMMTIITGLKDRLEIAERLQQKEVGAKAGIASLGAIIIGVILVSTSLISIILGVLNYMRHP